MLPLAPARLKHEHGTYEQLQAGARIESRVGYPQAQEFFLAKTLDRPARLVRIVWSITKLRQYPHLTYKRGLLAEAWRPGSVF
jgi:hypothetical protein